MATVHQAISGKVTTGKVTALSSNFGTYIEFIYLLKPLHATSSETCVKKLTKDKIIL